MGWCRLTARAQNSATGNSKVAGKSFGECASVELEPGESNQRRGRFFFDTFTIGILDEPVICSDLTI